ncbi:peptidase MA family metallohydrolase [Irregularibacter muris]|uniref:Peptidase MA family metallohydrolase n=1 Tax=Irregularibacter muris TaxID=1796619 RepID=A0AAE3L2U4_9FIRM|nr:peptidase MA family metallohydrolase [Irregularibacter muris]MCR1899294.1 peptidase MA family metallohydrolase [Irregularibacter muris]
MKRIGRINRRKKSILFLFLISALLLAYFNLNRLITHIEKVQSNVLIYRLEDYEIEQSDEFSFYYKENDRQYMQNIIKTSQDMIKSVNKNMKQDTPVKFNMVIYPDSMEMNKGLRLPSGEETLGAYYGGNIFLLSPRQLNLENNKIENIILHEYTHLLVEEKTKGNHPIWFTEGIALYQEYSITGYEWGKGYRFPMDTPLYLEQLERHFNEVDTFAAYRASFLRIQYLSERYGKDALLNIMDKMGENKSYDEAVQSILGKSKNQLENEFMLWYHG